MTTIVIIVVVPILGLLIEILINLSLESLNFILTHGEWWYYLNIFLGPFRSVGLVVWYKIWEEI